MLSDFSQNDLCYANFLKINTNFTTDSLLSSNIYFGCTGKVSYNVNMAHTKYKRTEPTPIVVWKNRNILRKSDLIFLFVSVKRSYNDVKIICRSGKITYQKKYTVNFHKEKTN